MTPLTGAEIEQLLMKRPKWSLEGGKLVRDFRFSSFEEAILFVNRVAALAESRDHHPDIDIRYNHVVLSLISHDAKGLTTRDASLAEALDLAFSPTFIS